MPEAVIEVLTELVEWLEIIGGSALCVGFIYATAKWLINISRIGAIEATEDYRKAMGRAILIGLEVLVAATIIKTITVDPTVKSLSFLAIMVAIRTALSWSTVLEINGRWPWQQPPFTSQ